MDAPWWNGDPPDDDPEGEHQPDGSCEWCGAREDELCDWECDCPACRRKHERDGAA